VLVTQAAKDGFEINGLWRQSQWPPGANNYGYNDDVTFQQTQALFSGRHGYYVDPNGGADNEALKFFSAFAESNSGDGFNIVGQGDLFIGAHAEVNGGYGFRLSGTTASSADSWFAYPWFEGNTLGGIRFENSAVRNLVTIGGGFTSQANAVTEDSTSENLLEVTQTGMLSLEANGLALRLKNSRTTPPLISVAKLTTGATGAAALMGVEGPNISSVFTSGPTYAIDPTTSSYFAITLQGNVAFSFTGTPRNGQWLTVEMKQDATGSRTCTWPSGIAWQGHAAPACTATAGARDIVTLRYNGGWVELVRAVGVL
jgi:hypothetical protein